MTTHTASVLSRNIFALGRISSILLILAILHSSSHQASVRCQDFEDLNNNNSNNNHLNNNKQAIDNAGQQSAFQPSRQFGAQPAAPSNSRQSFQRPVLSTRFSQQHQQLSGQASTVTNTVVPGQQQTLPTTPGQQQQQQQPAAQPVAASSNIEQIMKNALARTSRLEQTSAVSVESRQEQANEPIQSRSGPQALAQSMSAQTPTAALSVSTSARERSLPNGESSEAQASTQQAEEQQTTGAGQQGPVGNHETVYSDQRFANLFARRNNQKKSKFTPTEQIKAKPTLPSFIKSPPDPKQFNANSPENQDNRPITQASANIISARLQQQQANQGRQPVSQKKPSPAITSNTAAAANNKRLNSQKQTVSGPTGSSAKGPSASRAGAPQLAAASAASKPNANNPFNKSQQSNSDPANVIAMARRRLLANNAAQQRPATN